MNFRLIFLVNCVCYCEQGWITALSGDRAEVSYKLFIANGDVKNQMKEFNMDERLDVFYMNYLSRHIQLREVVKLLMILSHGNARAESGFSANEQMLVENMSEGSLVARRMVFDGLMNEGAFFNVDVNRKMLKFVNNVHSEYVKQLDKQKEQQTSGEKKSRKKKNHQQTEEGKASKAEVHRTT